jgi:hypothetical protein
VHAFANATPMDGHLSGPLIARGLVAALSAIIACATTVEHDLALGKDFAVSLPLCCPYGGIGPSSSGWGPPRRFQHGRHCSHLYSYERRLLAATFLSNAAFYGDAGECPDFPLCGHRLLKGSHRYSDRLDDQQKHDNILSAG